MGRYSGGLVSDSTSSTIGVVGEWNEWDGSLDPVEGWTISSLDISAKSALESEESGDSFEDSWSEDSDEVSSDSDEWE